MWGSRMISNYAVGAARGVTGALGPGAKGLHSGVRAAGFTHGSALRGVGSAMGAFGRTGAGASMYGGAAAGGLYGAVSGDTSIIGGATMGAAAGFGAARYGGAALRGMRRARNPAVRGMPAYPGRSQLRRGLSAMRGQIKGDALLISNKAVNGFGALRGRMGRAAGSIGNYMRNR